MTLRNQMDAWRTQLIARADDDLKPGERWVTINGALVLIDGQGKVVEKEEGKVEASKDKLETKVKADSVKIPTPSTMALTEQVRQWRARLLQPFPVARADADDQPPSQPKAENADAQQDPAPSGGGNADADAEGKDENADDGGEGTPPEADEVGELNKDLIAAELELEFAKKDYRKAVKDEQDKEDDDTSGLSDLLELAKKVESFKKKIIKIQRQLEIVNAQSIAVPTPVQPDPNAELGKQQDAQNSADLEMQATEHQAQSESEGQQQQHEQLTQAAEQAHEQSMQQQQQAHEIALAQQSSEVELKKEQIKASATKSKAARADSAVVQYNPVTVRSDRDMPVMVDNTPVMKSAAGILFITDGGRVLLGLRAEPGNYFDHWGIFGGRQEPGETLEMTAVREVLEETGHSVALEDNGSGLPMPAPVQSIAQTVLDGTVFTYFVHVCTEPFATQLNEEHHACGWYAMGEEPQPMIPGLQAVLASPEVRKLRLKKMNEMDIAKAMSYGELPSPTKYANMSLYRMRVTGTGKAFRRGDGKNIADEYVIRPPELYLNSEFVERCNGIDVIWQHPPKRVMDSKEWNERKAGTIMLAYLAGDEVWCVAKIIDTDTITILDNERMSTSPTVVFGDKAVNRTISLSNGSTLLIEGKPTLFDHLAICELGVWDKGGEPRGIESDLVVTQ